LAIYHCSTKPISRSTGRSSVAAAAYRSGQQLEDERTGKNHDFTKKRGVEYTNIITPHDIEVSRSELWNAAEESENRKDARTAREWLVALPDELTQKQRMELVNQFGRELSNRYGSAIDIAIHSPDKGGDQRNYHAHILMTTREVHSVDNRLQFGAKTNLELSNTKREKLGLCKTDDEIKIIREEWATHTNNALERAGKSERIDHRSNAERGIEQEPTIHEGVAATAMKRRGIEIVPVLYNKSVKSRNDERKNLKDVVHSYDKELDTLATERVRIEKQIEAYKLDKPVEKEYTKEPPEQTPFSRKLDEIRANLETSDKALQSIDFGAAQQNIVNNIERVQLSQEIAIRQLTQQAKELKISVKETPVKEYTKEEKQRFAYAAKQNFNAAVHEKAEQRVRVVMDQKSEEVSQGLAIIKREKDMIAFQREQLGQQPMLIGREQWEQRNTELTTRLFELETKEKNLLSSQRETPTLNQYKEWATEQVRQERPELAQKAEKAQQYLEREAKEQPKDKQAEREARLAEAKAIGEREAAKTQPERDKEREAAAERQRNYDRQR
jgi:hypothetical protein